ncbi:polyketide synthase [Cladorrhinum samala]|uniref:Polyketide synthase n=1 Tax=Cladorrhinum samala TaxID=585594 RepID=A0AAV9HJL9_9PEZI|nr:polyketide synthase [Cladorrhinum samala]
MAARKSYDDAGCSAKSSPGVTPAMTPLSTLSSNATSVDNQDLMDQSQSPADGPVEPIAIIGMSCRLPGTATDISSLWNMLVSGGSAWTPGPGKRFNMSAFCDPTGTKPGTTNVGGGHWLKEDVAAFDAAFFGINPVEAVAMDPQHRLLLEVAYEAFENAGLSTEFLSGSNTGVFVGQWSSDYHEIQIRDTERNPQYLITGTGPALTSGRISYQFNLKGPCFTVDTGCSSSTVALHQAILSLRAGETAQCFVGGANLVLDPQRLSYQSRLKMLSNEGRSFPFDSRATGYGRGEGFTGVVLKPLSSALKDGDQIRAVIRNSVLNQNGRTAGITAPNESAQREAILRAYRQAKLPLYADYVEAHGTGTKAGDPVEAGAIASVLGRNRERGQELPIGSIKGNIGHTEGSAGLAGLIKAVLMLENGIIPPQVNYSEPNPEIHLDHLKLRIPKELERQDLRRISVNSFGYGGTNAHVIVDSATNLQLRAPSPEISQRGRGLHVFVLTAASSSSLRSMCKRLANYLINKQRSISDTDRDVLLSRLAYTLSRRTLFDHRIALVAGSIEDLVSKLLAESATQTLPITSADAQSDRTVNNRTLFVFSGQGAQYPEMGRSMLQQHPTFLKSLQRANSLFSQLGCSWDLITELGRPAAESRINEPAFAQPISTAIQLALVDLLAERGVLPYAAVGHSSGEIAAAYAAGILSFEDSAAAAYYRGLFTGELFNKPDAGLGAMLAVGDSPEEVEKHIANLGSDVHGSRMRIACFNSPSSVTVSGDEAAIDRLKTYLDEKATFNRKLLTGGVAYHSHHMEPIADSYAKALEGLLPNRCSAPHVRMISSVTGQSIDEATLLDGRYWVRNLLSPVLFSQAIKSMLEQEPTIDTIVELGPHAQLEGPIKQILKSVPSSHVKVGYTSTLKRKEDAQESFLKCLGFLYIQGHRQVSLDTLNEISEQDGNHQKSCSISSPSLLVDVPPYPFDHERTFWHETRLSKDYRNRPHLPHELLGSLSLDVNPFEPRWRKFLSVKETPWLKHHVVQDQILLPATGFLTMVIQAALQDALAQAVSSTQGSRRGEKASVSAISLRNVSIGKALVLSEDEDREVSLSLRPQPRTARESSDVWNEFRIFSVASDGLWTEHCRGLVHVERESVEGENGKSSRWWLQDNAFDALAARCVIDYAPRTFYRIASESAGLSWDSSFKNMSAIQVDRDMRVSLSTSRVPDVVNSNTGGVGDIIHPGLFDTALLHGTCFLTFQGQKGIEKSAAVPTFIKELRLANKPITTSNTEELLSVTEITEDATAPYDVAIRRKDGLNAGEMILQARGIRISELPRGASTSEKRKELCRSAEWVTYMDSPLTLRHRDQLCKSSVPPASIADVNKALEALTLHHVQRTLRQVSPSDIPEGSYFHHMYKWMESVADESYDQSLISESTLGADVLGEAIIRLGPHLHDVLTEKIVPLSILTQDKLLSRIYAEQRSARCYAQMAAWAKELGRFSPGLRILEIGAGTGSTTAPILEAMGEYVGRYDFTDVSTGFFEGAKHRLGSLANGRVEYKVFDAERDPIEQGFEPESYDLVIASNVIHATRRIDDTLRRVRALLRPGGRFMLLEITNHKVFYNIIFGVFEGWWAGYDEGRKMSPLQTTAQWVSRLHNAGFVSDDQSLFTDFDENEGGTTSVFVSQAPNSSPATEARRPTPPISLLFASPAQKSNALDDIPSFQSRLDMDVAVSAHHVAETSPGNNIVVILPEIAYLLGDGVEDDVWSSFKNWLLSARAVVFVDALLVGEDRTRPSAGMWTGFIRCLRLEHPDIRFLTLQLQQSANPDESSVLGRAAAAFSTLLAQPTFDLDTKEEVEDEFAEKDGQLFVSRLMSFSEMNYDIQRNSQQADPEMTPFITPGRTMKAELGVPGLLETLRWRDDLDAPPLSSLGPDDVRIELKAASINFKDVLIAAGQLEGITEMRNDCAGVVVEVGVNMQSRFQPGDRVCALYSRSYTNYPVVHGDCVHLVPESMPFSEAAALPVVWTTVYYSLVELGRLKRGDKVLIHSAAGAVGQAAVILSQYIGAEVFATVGGEAKRELLQTRYGIPSDHIFSSRNPDFFENIRRVTNNYGVDVVLNSLSGEMFRLSCDLVAPFGRFVEIGRKDLMDDVLMPTKFLLRNVTFAYVDFGAVMEQNKPLAGRLLTSVVELAAAGSIRPVTITTMSISEIESAFRLIQAGKHMGKLILTVDEGQMVRAIPSAPDRVKLREDATYIIAGGLGGLGRALVSWLADCGAKNIMTLSRSGANDARSAEVVHQMGLKGVKMVAKSCDISSESQVAEVLQEIDSGLLPPVRGIIQSAMVLRDSMFQNMTAQEWNQALAPKVRGTINLNNVFGRSGNLDFLIMLSSAVVLSGNFGQSNYAAACAFQDTLARRELQLGDHFYSINVGPVMEAGYVRENPEAAELLKRSGVEMMSLTDLLSVVNSALTQNRDSSLPKRDNRCITGIPPPNDKNASWLRQKRFLHLQQYQTVVQKTRTGDSVANVGVLLGAAQRFEDAVDIICHQILQQLGKLIATPAAMLSATRSLDSYGVDSLVLVELRNWIGATLQATVQVMTLRGARSIKELARIVAKGSRLVDLEAA